MSDHRDIYSESRALALQAAVFRALRDHGLEPELSDTSTGRVPPADTFHEQMFRTLAGTGIVAHLRATIGDLEENERRWVHRVVDAACRRHERREALKSRSTRADRKAVAVGSTSTATTTAVVFRRRIGGGT